jgi:hypothetical protein
MLWRGNDYNRWMERYKRAGGGEPNLVINEEDEMFVTGPDRCMAACTIYYYSNRLSSYDEDQLHL